METQICKVKKQGGEPHVTNQQVLALHRINVYSWQSSLISLRGARNRQGGSFCTKLSFQGVAKLALAVIK